MRLRREPSADRSTASARRRRRGAVLAALLVTLVPVGSAQATGDGVPTPAPEVEVVTAGGRFWPGTACVVRDAGFCIRSDRPLTITQGTTLKLRNYDVPHDLRSEALTSDGRSLFASPRVFLRESKKVLVNADGGVLPVGTYRFYCTLHPPAADGTGMQGILRVVEAVSA